MLRLSRHCPLSQPHWNLRPQALWNIKQQRWLLALVVGCSGVSTAWADPNLPAGYEPTLSSGVSSVVNSGTTQTITTNAQNSLGSFNTFNIGGGYTVNVNQPNAGSNFMGVVRSGSPTQIYGNLNSNGTVGIVNPGGVYVGPNGSINTQGFIGTTHQLDQEKYLLEGQLEFNHIPGNTSSVVNDGSITVGDNGFVLLSGQTVENNGTITAPNGEVNLVASDRVQLSTLDGVNLRLERAASLHPNDPLFSGIVNNTGKISVSGLYEHSGQITLLAPNGRINFSGSALAETGAPSSIDLLGDDIHVSGSLIANSETGGGSIRVGGEYQGQLNSYTINATTTTITETATLQANALESGNGGTIIAWADDITTVGGNFEAKGGPNGGNGGLVETSGKVTLTVEGTTTVDTTAANGQTGTWLLDPEDLTIANSGGDITPTTIVTNLNSNNVTLTTNNTSGSEDGDIFVNDAISWGTGNSLTLNAYRNIDVNAAITNTGAGNLVLRADSTGTGTGTVNFGGSGSVSLNTGRADLYYNPTNYASPTNYSGNITGTHTAWMLVHDVNDLQAMNTNLSGDYALSQDIDASATSGWNSGAGFDDIGESSNAFTGNFDGQNFTISDLLINRPSAGNAGLFGYADGASFSNVTLSNVNISASGDTGALVGELHNGTVNNVHSSGSVSITGEDAGGLIGDMESSSVANSSSAVSVSGVDDIGGLIGDIKVSGSVTNSFATGTVAGADDDIGGLVGEADNATITGSYATGNVSGDDEIGGLVGDADAGSHIIDSYSTSHVSGDDRVGGLVGEADNATITGSYATGNVSGDDDVGGLIGDINTSGSVTNSFATGTVAGADDDIGGLVGEADNATITGSYATGNVSGDDKVGGLIGNLQQGSTIADSYSTATVSGDYEVGGLVGEANHAGTVITNSHSTGSVSGNNEVGGLVGELDQTASITDSYSESSVTATNDEVGGLVGYMNNATVTGSYSTGLVTGDDKVGGLVGLANNGSQIIASYATGSVTGDDDVGGLVGEADNATITGSYATGNVSGDDEVGGLVGDADAGSHIIDSYSTSHVSGDERVGGLVGELDDNGTTVSGSYSTGDVSGRHNVGGLIGEANESASIFNSYSESIVTATGDDVGGLIGEANNVSVTGVYSTGSVTGDDRVGGLIGQAINMTLSDLYNSSTVTGDGEVGGLVGQLNNVSLADSYATGTVSGRYEVGGLVGEVINGSSINSSYATGNVLATEDRIGGLVGLLDNSILASSYATGLITGGEEAGGLVGLAINSSSISNSYATGNVSANSGDDAGGLAGEANNSTITNSYATGNVTGAFNDVGGLLGDADNGTIIRNSYATGSVTGNQDIGGLVGENSNSAIESSYALGNVNGIQDVGGLVGDHENGASIISSFAAGSVTGSESTGGLVGENENASILNSYATGDVVGNNETGGLVGKNEGATITNSYSAGSVAGGADTGGLVGLSISGASTNSSYWNMESSGQASSAGGTGLTTAQMQGMSNYAGWDIANTGGSSAVWRIYEGQTSPLLRTFMTNLDVTINAVKIYDGSTLVTSPNAIYSGFVNGDNASVLLGSLSTTTASENVGTYNVTGGGLYSAQLGYDINYNPGTVTITPRVLVVSVADAVKAQGKANPTFALESFADQLVGSDSVGSILSGSPSFSTGASQDSPVGNYAINTGLSAFNGSRSSNYSISLRPGQLRVLGYPQAIREGLLAESTLADVTQASRILPPEIEVPKFQALPTSEQAKPVNIMESITSIKMLTKPQEQPNLRVEFYPEYNITELIAE